MAKYAETPAIEKAEKADIDITPKRDYVLHCPPDHDTLELKAGQPATVKARFKAALEADGVI